MAAPHTNQRIGGTVTDAGGSTISGAVVKIEDETSGESLNKYSNKNNPCMII